MKKILIGIAILAVAGAGVYWFFFHSNRHYPETVLPENTAVYFYFPGLDQIQKEASQTLLWKRVAASPRKDLYTHQLSVFMRSIESVVGVDPQPLLKQFSRETAIAVIPVTESVQSGSLIAYVKKEKETRDFLEMKLDPSLKRRFPDLKKAPVVYLEKEYFKYTSGSFKQNLSPCYAFLDHHLLVTSSEVGMKVLQEVHDKKQKPLQENDVFGDVKREVHFKDPLFFLNAKGALAVLKNRLPGRVQPFWPAFLKVSGIESVQAFAYRLGFDGEGFREEAFVAVDRKRSGFAKAYMEQRPQKLSGVSFLPATSEAAGAGTLPDGLMVWKEVQAQIESVLSGGQFSQWKSMLEFLGGFLNLELERDFVDPLGRQFSFAYDSNDTDGSSQPQRYFIAVELKKPDHFRSVIEKLIQLAETRGVRRRPELYQGKTLQILEVGASGMNAAPAVWFEGSWFYVGTAQTFAKETIEAMKNKKTLSANPDFQRVTAGFPEEMNSISYTNTQASLRHYANMLEAQANETDRKWIRQYGLIEEMNDLSKVLFGSASYSVIEKDGVRYHSYSSIPNSLLLLQPVVTAALD